jgi:hypothetical protein
MEIMVSMRLTASFRLLTPKSLHLPAALSAEPDVFSGLVARHGSGMAALTLANGELVELTSSCEERSALPSFQALMQSLRLPLPPRATLKVVFDAIEPYCPHLLITKPSAAIAYSAGIAQLEQLIGVTSDGLAIQTWFTAGRLTSIKFRDLGRSITVDPQSKFPRALRAAKQAEARSRYLENPLSALVDTDYLALPAASEVAWSSNFVIEESTVTKAFDPDDIPSDAFREGTPYCDLPRRGVLATLSSRFTKNPREEAMDAERLGIAIWQRKRLERKYGNLPTLITTVPRMALARRVADWLLADTSEMAAADSEVGQMALVLEEFRMSVESGLGFASWLENHFHEASDLGHQERFLLTIRVLQATPLENILNPLCIQLNEAGLDWSTRQGWTSFLQTHSIEPLELAAYHALPALFDSFYVWLATNPQLLAANEAEAKELMRTRPWRIISTATDSDITPRRGKHSAASPIGSDSLIS